MCYVIRKKLRRNRETERNSLGWTGWTGGRDACVNSLERNLEEIDKLRGTYLGGKVGRVDEMYVLRH